ncbi:MAG TPA: site-specific integrase [Actinomycetota bacterium]
MNGKLISASSKHLPPGRWPDRYRAWYRDAAYRNVGKVFKRKDDAEAFLRQKAHEDVTGTLADTRAGQQTLQELYDEVHAERDYAPATVKMHEQVWAVVGPTLGSRRIGVIRPAHVGTAVAKFSGQAMQAKARSVLSSMFSQAKAKGRIVTNPAEAPRRKKTRAERMAEPKTSVDEHRYIGEDDLAQLVAEMPERYRALVELMAYAGLRPGEAYALRVGKFDPDERTLDIDTSITGHTKTGEARRLVLPAVLAQTLTAHIESYSDPSNPEALMFPTRDGSMLTLSGFRSIFQRASARADVNHGLSPNDLRHYAAAFAIGQGASVYAVQRMLGHAKPSITLDIYGSLWDDSLETLATSMEEAIRASMAKVVA